MSSIWLAIVILTPRLYPTSQAACAAATPGMVISKKWVYRISYPTHESLKNCCDALAPKSDENFACKIDPEDGPCGNLSAPKIESFECVPEPSYSVIPGSR